MVVPDEPDWAPLERAAVEWLCGGFMAMEEAQLRNGAYVRCYKHRDTRRSLHLDADLDAYVYSYDPRRPGASGKYERVSVHEAFARVVLLPQFEDGWIARGQFDRPWRVNEDGGEIEPAEDDCCSPSSFELLMAEECWERRNLDLAQDE